MDKNKLRVWSFSPPLCLSPHCSASHLCDAVSQCARCPLELSHSLICFPAGSLPCLLPEHLLLLQSSRENGTASPKLHGLQWHFLIPLSYHYSFQDILSGPPIWSYPLSLLITGIALPQLLTVLVPGSQLSSLAQILLPS